MRRKYLYPKVTNAAQILNDRRYNDIEEIVKNRMQTAPQFMDKLELETELKGHSGCVNCLEWSDDGRILASASDDYHVMLWDPFRHKQLYDLTTPHQGNIFSVKFLPKSDNSKIITGAGDSKIFVFDVNRNNDTPIWMCTCHGLRVKRLATAPEQPNVFWSAGEDGIVMQFDLRQKHKCGSNDEVVFVNLRNHIASSPEAKCVSVNQRRPELIAIGANDCYARIYDRRMMSLSALTTSANDAIRFMSSGASKGIPKNGCVTYYCPGHLLTDKDHPVSILNNKAVTYLAFSSDGTELLVNMGSEQIYLYDINNSRKSVLLELPKFEQTNGTIAKNCGATKPKMPSDVELMKKTGNRSLESEKYMQAILQYTLAIKKASTCSILYLNRATAYMKRGWFGDVYAAIRDCHTALNLDPHYVKAHFRLARALLELGEILYASVCLAKLVERFPSHAKNHGILMLAKDIDAAHVRSRERNDQEERDRIPVLYSDYEIFWRTNALDYEDRFVGHCNTKTDIKEANFFGNDANYIVAGSDDGNFFLWERPTNMIRSIFQADESIVNCVQPHPHICMLATSGIDHEIRLWSPQAEVKTLTKYKAELVDDTVRENQYRMQADPFDLHAADPAVCRAS